jgi:hypothetical protein
MMMTTVAMNTRLLGDMYHIRTKCVT